MCSSDLIYGTSPNVVFAKAASGIASAADLKPNAILITHEHSDHFHEPTLQRFDRGTTIYVPDFPNQRMQTQLAALGFTDVRVMRFGEDLPIAPGWSMTAFEPSSLWNDALVLVEGLEAVDLDGRVVDEDVLVSAVNLDEAVALLLIEPLHSA